jgi:hypothetical protein
MYIPKEFKKYGYTYTQESRYGKRALYRVTDRATEGTRQVGWEVVRVTPQKPFMGRAPSLSEHYPSTAEFGRLGWYYKDEEKARDKYLSLPIE